MTLHSGAQVMHHGRAIELLYRHGRVGTTEIWKCKLLFVEPREVLVHIGFGDRVTPIHGGHK